MVTTRGMEQQRCSFSLVPSNEGASSVERVRLSSSELLPGQAECDDVIVYNALERTGVLPSIRRAFVKFICGCIIYLLSWSTILCRIIRGLVKYPDEMPMPVWIATIGLLLLYETFIISECTSVSTRIRHILESKRGDVQKALSAAGMPVLDPSTSVLCALWDEMHCSVHLDKVAIGMFFLASLEDPFSITVIGSSVSIDLVGAILYSVPSIREWFGIPEETRRAEPWSIIVLLLLIWTLVLVSWQALSSYADTLVTRDRETPLGVTQYVVRELVLGSYSAILQFAMYAVLTATLVLGWGYFVMASTTLVSDAQLVWVLLAVLASTVLSTVAFVLAARRIRDPLTVADKAVANEIGGRSPQTVVEDLSRSHRNAACFHFCLILMTLFLGLGNTDLDWSTEYIGLRRPTYLFTVDYSQMDDANSNATLKALLGNTTEGKTQIGWCASPTDMPIFTIILSLGWSSISMLQHFISMRTLTPGACRSWLVGNFTTVFRLSVLAVTAIVVPAALRSEWTWYGTGAFTALLLSLVIPALYTFLVGMLELYPDAQRSVCVLSRTPTEAECSAAVVTVSAFKWIEYTFSATMMHVVVCVVAGIYSGHEVVLAGGLLAISLGSVHLVEAEMQHMEKLAGGSKALASAPQPFTVAHRAALEGPFISLSFFAKGVLCLALTIPFLFINRSDFEVVPQWCSR